MIFVHFGQMVYFRWQPATSVQNFIHLRQSAAELLMFVQKSKITAAVILNYIFVMLDHPQSPFVHLKFSLKFRVDRVRTFEDIAIRKFRKFGLKCLFRPQKFFGESFNPQTLFFIIETHNRGYLTRKRAFWAINGRDRSSGVTCRREQEYKKRINRTQKSNGKFPSYPGPLSVVPHQPNFECRDVYQMTFLVSSFIKIGWKMWELWGVEILAFPFTWHIAYTTGCGYRTCRDLTAMFTIRS